MDVETLDTSEFFGAAHASPSAHGPGRAAQRRSSNSAGHRPRQVCPTLAGTLMTHVGSNCRRGAVTLYVICDVYTVLTFSTTKSFFCFVFEYCSLILNRDNDILIYADQQFRYKIHGETRQILHSYLTRVRQSAKVAQGPPQRHLFHEYMDVLVV